MAYVLRYKPNGQYLNLSGRSTEPLSLGINPQIYKEIHDAKKALKYDVERNVVNFRHFLNMGDQGLRVKGKPVWYDERHTKKLTATQQKKLDWYENALKTNEKYHKFLDNFKLDDVEIVEWSE